MAISLQLFAWIFVIPCLLSSEIYAAAYYDAVVGFDEPVRSYIDFGAKILDAPAGKHGMLKVIDDNLYFDDGTPARFWGINIARGAAFPDHDAAELLASRIAFYGFNVVRFHHIDATFEPNGIFQDVYKKSKNYDNKRTGILSQNQLDKLDYFVFQLKKLGIYVNFNLLSARRFTLKDGVPFANELRRYSVQAGKPASMFDPDIINLQKQYIRDLLSHKNPYTSLTYAEDATIAFLEIANETSLFRYWITGRLDGGVLGKGPDFPEYYVKQLDEKWKDWLRKESKLTGDMSVLRYQRAPWKQRKLYSDEEVNALIRFYRDIEIEFTTEIIRFIKNEAGSKALINAGGHYFSMANLQAQSSGDFIAPHYYWDPARWPGKKWDRNNFNIKDTSLLKGRPDRDIDLRNPIQDIGIQQIQDRPLLVTEWNHWFPNSFGYELPLMLAAYGSLQDWDGAMIFTFSRRPVTSRETYRINDYFDIHSNPQKLVLNAIASLLFNKRMVSEANQEIKVNLDDDEVTKNVSRKGSIRRPEKEWEIDGTTFLKHKVSLFFNGTPDRHKSISTKLPSKIYSDTGELVWDRSRSLFTIDANGIKGVVGFLADAGDIELSDTMISGSQNGVILLISLDGTNIADSTRMLIACVGNVTNKGAVWNYPEVVWGEGPAQLRKMSGHIKFSSNAAYHYTPLDVNGRLSGESIEIKSDTHTKLTCPNDAPWALIERKSSNDQSGHKSDKYLLK